MSQLFFGAYFFVYCPAFFTLSEATHQLRGRPYILGTTSLKDNILAFRADVPLANLLFRADSRFANLLFRDFALGWKTNDGLDCLADIVSGSPAAALFELATGAERPEMAFN